MPGWDSLIDEASVAAVIPAALRAFARIAASG
jgi:hypothetical protein